MKDGQQRSGGMWNLLRKGGIPPAVASVFGAQNAQQMAFIRSVMKDQRKTSQFDVPLKDMEFVVFDLETTGFMAQQGDEIISIGAVAVTGGEIRDSETFYSVVNPGRKIPDEICALTGISDDMVSGAPSLIDSLHRFLEFVHRRCLIAHGAGHDKTFLNAALWKTSKVTLTHRVLDTMMIGKWLEPNKGAYDLDSLLESYHIPIAHRHHALHDSLMTAKLWSAFVRKMYDRQVVTLGDLYAHLSRH